MRDFTIISWYVYFAKIPISRDFYAKECLKKKVNRQKANYDLGVGPDEK